MAFQTPKSDHPWRNYKDKKPARGKAAVEKNVRPVYKVVRELVESWETIEIITFANGRDGKHLLNDLPQTRQAAWLASLLKRNYK